MKLSGKLVVASGRFAFVSEHSPPLAFVSEHSSSCPSQSDQFSVLLLQQTLSLVAEKVTDKGWGDKGFCRKEMTTFSQDHCRKHRHLLIAEIPLGC